MGVVVAAHAPRSSTSGSRSSSCCPDARDDAEAVARFLREARAAVAASRASTSRASSTSGTLDDGAPYMVMEYLEGDDLARRARASAARSRSTRPSSYVLQACEALAEAHALGIVHRDLKPANLFLTHARRRHAARQGARLRHLEGRTRRAAHGEATLTQTTAVHGLAALHVARADAVARATSTRAPTSGRSASSSTSS